MRGRMPAPSVNRDGPAVDGILSLLRTLRSSMGETSQRVADLILDRPNDVLGMSLTEVAEAAQASEALVIKLCQQVGVGGLQALKISLAQELVKPTQFIHEDLAPGDALPAVIQKVFHANIAALQDTLTVLKPEALK